MPTTDPLDTGILPVPFVSQVGNWYTNDCGAACCAMLLKAYLPDFSKSVETLFEEIYKDRNKYKRQSLFRKDLISILAKDGVNAELKNGLTIERIAEFLRKGRPIIALINLNVLSNSAEPLIEFPHKSMLPKDACPHFVVVIGMDSNFFCVNDPNFSLAKKAKYPQPRLYPVEAFKEAWRRANEQGNGSNTGVVPVHGLPGLVKHLSNDQPENISGTPFLPYQVRVIYSTGLNIRPGPAKSFAPIGGLKVNDERKILAENADRSFGLIQKNPDQWISLSPEHVIVISGASGNAAFNSYQVIVVNQHGINIRSGPAMTFDDVGDLNFNDKCTILKESDDRKYGLIQISPERWITLSTSNVRRI